MDWLCFKRYPTLLINPEYDVIIAWIYNLAPGTVRMITTNNE